MLWSIDVGRRLRHNTIEIPTALAMTANNRNATSAPRYRADGMLLDCPVGSLRPMFLLPDRDRFFERVDRVRGGLERRRAVGGRHHNHARRFRERQMADPMQNRDPLEVGPAHAHV